MKCFATFMVIAMVVLGTALVASAQDPAILWLKADAITGLSDGDTVNIWPDSSPNGNNPTNVLGTPIYKTGIVNSKPVVRFDGNSRMEAPHDDSLNATSYTEFVVCKFGNAAATEMIISKGDPTDAPAVWTFLVYARSVGGGVKQHEWSVRHEDGVGGTDQAAVRGTTDWGTANFHIGTAWFEKGLLPDSTSNPNAAKGYTDGSNDTAGSTYHLAQADVTLDPLNTKKLILGRQGAADPRGFSGDIAEIAILNYAASEPDILDVNTYLGAKYGITVPGGGDAGNGYTILAGTAVSGNPGTLIYGK